MLITCFRQLWQRPLLLRPHRRPVGGDGSCHVTCDSTSSPASAYPWLRTRSLEPELSGCSSDLGPFSLLLLPRPRHQSHLRTSAGVDCDWEGGCVLVPGCRVNQTGPQHDCDGGGWKVEHRLSKCCNNLEYDLSLNYHAHRLFFSKEPIETPKHRYELSFITYIS